MDAERVWADAVGMERPGRLGYVGAGRGVTPRPPLGELRPPKPVPKMTNRFWDACAPNPRLTTPPDFGTITMLSRKDRGAMEDRCEN